jgi:hypothetical protein
MTGESSMRAGEQENNCQQGKKEPLLKLFSFLYFYLMLFLT